MNPIWFAVRVWILVALAGTRHWVTFGVMAAWFLADLAALADAGLRDLYGPEDE